MEGEVGKSRLAEYKAICIDIKRLHRSRAIGFSTFGHDGLIVTS